MAAIALVLVACGGDDDGGASASPAASGTQASAASATIDTSRTAGPTARTPGADELNVCNLATSDEVGAALGENVNAGAPTNFDPFAACLWTGDSFNTVTATAFTGDAASIEARYGIGRDEPVAGLGEAADWDGELKVLDVRVNETTVLSISIFHTTAGAETLREGAIALAEKMLERF